MSVALPAWLLGHNPAARIIAASYGQELADKLAWQTRALMQAGWYFRLFGTQLSDRQAVHDFGTTAQGGRMATSVNGVLTGRGGDFLLLDDIQKPDDALSEVQRRRVNDWFSNSLLSRLDDKQKGCIIIVMQRLHQDDLVGHLQSGANGDEWEVLSFPAIAESEESHLIEGSLGRRLWVRKAGEALHPEREPVDLLRKLQRDMGAYNFAGQYQQNPLPQGGALVKTEWLRFYEAGEEPAKFDLIVQSWDTANKANELNDFSVGTTWGVRGNDIYLLDVFRRRVNFPDLKRAVLSLYEKYRPHVLLIEDRASGVQLIQDLKDRGIRVTPYSPGSVEKQIRLHAQTDFFENGRVFLRKDAPWLQAYVDELIGFPGTKYDDQIDSTTQFLDVLRQRRRPLLIPDELLRRARLPGPRTGR